MAYHGVKRLLGETSLERKTFWMLGGGVLVLMAISFYFYAQQTESLAYDQLTHTGRALVSPIVARIHVQGELGKGMEEFQTLTEETWPEAMKGYKYQLIVPFSSSPERQGAPADLGPLHALIADDKLNEVTRARTEEQVFDYYGAVRAGQSCVECHRDPEMMALYSADPFNKAGPRIAANPDLHKGELMAVVRVRLSTEPIEAGFHQNRAYLITFALATTLLVVFGVFMMMRFIVVKPVKHLKAVADAIAAGQINVRSEIQTGDEFEDLSDAFNRMLRNLTNMQERNGTLIAKLDLQLDKLARTNMELHESYKARGDFLSTMSHELRTPLNSIIGFSEVLLGGDNLTEKQHRWAGNIMTSGQQLLALINDILEVAKLEAGKMRVHPETLQPREVCERAVSLFRHVAEKKTIELRIEVPEGISTIRQDPGKLGQILSNLLSNAIKFTPEGGQVTLSAATQGDEFYLIVSDTGVGIAVEEQELVFDKFRQASNPLTREQGGTGLGLSIVRELAKLLGGEVILKSALGRGSSFTVRIARVLQALPAIEMEMPDANPLESGHHRKA